MPIKRRIAKRRVNPEREFEIWASVLGAGYDFFDELAELGVTTDDARRPDRQAAAAAWARHGERCLAERDQRSLTAWGEEEFGRPWESKRR